MPDRRTQGVLVAAALTPEVGLPAAVAAGTAFEAASTWVEAKVGELVLDPLIGEHGLVQEALIAPHTHESTTALADESIAVSHSVAPASPSSPVATPATATTRPATAGLVFVPPARFGSFVRV